jgi:hypothetical protein
LIAVGALYVTLGICLGLGFPNTVATLLAGITTWSLCIMVLAYGEGCMRLAYRHGVFKWGALALLLGAGGGAHLIGGSEYFGSFGVVLLVLVPFVGAVSTLVERAMFTAAERYELRKKGEYVIP